MNVSKEYDGVAEHPGTHSLLLSKEDVPDTMKGVEKAVPKKINGKVSFALHVSFTQRKILRQLVHRIPKSQGTTMKSML